MLQKTNKLSVKLIAEHGNVKCIYFRYRHAALSIYAHNGFY